MGRKLFRVREKARGPQGRTLAPLCAVLAGLLLPATMPARAQAPKEEELEKAGRIASQPARDVGISKRKVPPVLQEAVEKPYAVPRRQDCRWLNYELARLNQALGPDFDVEDKSDEDKVEQLAYAGGEMIVNSLIPFRGLVREISGAGPADRRRTAAINAGLARRGYLRGLAAAKSCASSAMAAAE